jgi:hypothetical protein
MTQEQITREMLEGAGELTTLIYEGDVAAYGLIIVRKSDGFIRTLTRTENGFRFHLIAGAAHLQHDLLHAAEPLDEHQSKS